MGSPVLSVAALAGRGRCRHCLARCLLWQFNFEAVFYSVDRVHFFIFSYCPVCPVVRLISISGCTLLAHSCLYAFYVSFLFFYF
jgi:hypothetical protein